MDKCKPRTTGLRSDAGPAWVRWENLYEPLDSAIAKVTVARSHHMLSALAAAARGLAAGAFLVNFSARPEPFIVTETLKLPSISHKRCLR